MNEVAVVFADLKAVASVDTHAAATESFGARLAGGTIQTNRNDLLQSHLRDLNSRPTIYEKTISKIANDSISSIFRMVGACLGLEGTPRYDPVLAGKDG